MAGRQVHIMSDIADPRDKHHNLVTLQTIHKQLSLLLWGYLTKVPQILTRYRVHRHTRQCICVA